MRNIIVLFLLLSPILYAQSSSPLHSAPHSAEQVVGDHCGTVSNPERPCQDVIDLIEKERSERAAASEASRPKPQEEGHTPAPKPALEASQPPPAGGATSEEVSDLAAKFRMMREAREAKAKKQAANAAQGKAKPVPNDNAR